MAAVDPKLPVPNNPSVFIVDAPAIPPERTSTFFLCCLRIYEVYFYAIRKLVDYLDSWGLEVAGMIIGTLLIEPWQALKIAFYTPANWVSHFNFYNMNPTTLTNEELSKCPLLLLHGNFNNQSSWLDLASELQTKKIGPIFTVDLPNGELTATDYKIIYNKIREIKALYRKHHVTNVKINLAGFSRGSELASDTAWPTLRAANLQRTWDCANNIGKVIKIGTFLSKNYIDRIKKIDPTFIERTFEIVGKYDVLRPERSLLPPNHYQVMPTGHFGLISSTETANAIAEFLLRE